MRILIKYASRGRPEQFKRGIRSIHETILTKDFQVLVTADTDDDTMNNAEMIHFLSFYPNVKILWGLSDSKIHAINRDMDQADPWDLLINFSDDMVFVINHWDKQMVHLIRREWPEGTDFFAHFNDGFVNEKLPTMSVMGYDYYMRDGYIYFPEYKSVSCDAEAMFVAMMRGRHKHFNWEPYHHLHPANMPNVVPGDSTYDKNDKLSGEDTALYFSRKSICFGVPEEVRVCLPFNPNDRS